MDSGNLLSKAFGLSAAFVLLLPVHAGATGYYCDPVKGRLSNDGKTPATAWSRLQDVVDAGFFKTVIKSGDTVNLMTGNHGYVTLRDAVYSDWVTITSAAGHRAGLAGFYGYSIQKVALDRLWVTPLLADQFYHDSNKGIIWMGRSGDGAPYTQDVQVRNCRVFSVLDSSKWTAHDWGSKPSNGIHMYDCKRGVMEHNIVFNVCTGLAFNGTDMRITGNWVDSFAGDGMFAGGRGHIVEDNIVTNCYEDDTGWHNDGLQYYYAGYGNSTTIRRNVVIDTTDPSRAGSIHLQGITCFTEEVFDTVVENNYVISSTTHGLSFTGGGNNCQFYNNTVYGFRDGDPSPMRLVGSWTNSIARNNLVTSLQSDCPQDHNLEIPSPDQASLYFIDPSNFGFRLKAGSLAIDVGNDSGAPATDFEGDARPDGTHADVGADER